MKKFISVLGLTALLAIVLASLSSSTQKSLDIPVYRKVLYFVAETFDPLLVNSTAEHAISNLIYDGLFTINADLEVVPSLLERWDLDSSHTVYTFTLRNGVRFHDGSPVTIKDLKRTLDRLRSKENAVAELFRSIKSVEVEGDETIVVTLSQPYPPFISLLAAPMAKVIRKAGDSPYPSGTGAFKFQGIDLQDGKNVLTLVRNEAYRDGRPNIQRLELWQMTEDEAIHAVNKGHVHDTVNYQSPSGLAGNNPRVSELSAATPTTWVITLNTSKAPLSDLRLRDCLVAHFPRSELLKVYLKDHQEGLGFVPPVLLGSNTFGWKKKDAPSNCSDLTNRPLILDYPEVLRAGDSMCALMQKAWSSVGIEVQCKARPFVELLSRINKGTADLTFLSATLDMPDVDFFLSYFESATKTNFGSYRSKTIDRNLALARAEADRMKRVKFYEDINRELYDKSVTINVSYPRHISYRHSCLDGFELGIGGDLYVDYAKLFLKDSCEDMDDFK